MSLRLSGLNPLAYLGVEPSSPPQVVVDNRAPTANDLNFNLCTIWLDYSTHNVYVLTSVANNVAIWGQFMTTAGVIFQLTTDAGVVLPVAGNVNIAGGTNIGTTGAGSTVTINLDNNVFITGNYTTTNGNFFGINTTNTATPSVFSFLKQHNSAIIQNNDAIGSIQFGGYDGTQYLVAAEIQATCVGAPALNRVPAQITFFTRPDVALGALTQRMSIANNGQVLMPAADAGALTLQVFGGIQSATGNITATIGNFIASNGNYLGFNTSAVAAVSSNLQFLRNRGGGIITSGDVLGLIDFFGYDGTQYVSGAAIVASSLGTIGVNRVAANLIFATHPDAATGIAALTRMTITSEGNVQIAAPTAGPAITSIATYGQVVGGVNAAVLIDNAGVMGTVVSSARFKDNIHNMSYDEAAIYNLRPVNFHFKADPTQKKQYGLIAEEAAQVFPDIVNFEADGAPHSVRYHDMPAILLNEIQKLNKRVLKLEKELDRFLHPPLD